MMHITVGNKCYSSWSMRPWLLMRALDIPFDETVVCLDCADFETYRARAKLLGASGNVPMLEDGETVVWETLAIIDYIADKFPDKAVWPSDLAARAHARAISSEMHASFTALRSACPMNLGKKFAAKDRGPGVAADVARIEQLWRTARTKFGAGKGAFLYGDFSAADAMFAPVVSRLVTYSFDVASDTQSYIEAVIAHPAFQEWKTAGLAEHWIIDKDEVDEAAVETYRNL